MPVRDCSSGVTAVEGCTAAFRRELLSAAVAVPLAAAVVHPSLAAADDFTRTPSGISYLDVRDGTGPSPQKGDTCVVHWSGYTKGYQVRCQCCCCPGVVGRSSPALNVH
eukprot:GHUV01035516.1.p2 GENE.GHUV01035516.1~~GHUV01035516.1.p2  ORF type:complete len:109 (-),score=15.70 GHUV01035516.1:989-1315(-)